MSKLLLLSRTKTLCLWAKFNAPALWDSSSNATYVFSLLLAKHEEFVLKSTIYFGADSTPAVEI